LDRNNASAAKVVNEVARIVRETGGHLFATEIEEKGDKDLDEVQKKERSWFDGKSIILVVDHVLPTDSVFAPGGTWISALQHIPSANSFVLSSARSLEIANLSDETVEFAPLTSFEEETKMVLRYLGLHSNANHMSHDEVHADRVSHDEVHANHISDDDVGKLQEICGGVLLALATVASYLHSQLNNVRMSLDALRVSFVGHDKQAIVPGGHPGLLSIFGTVLSTFDGDKRGRLMRGNADSKLRTSRLPCSWTDLYTSLSVLDMSSPYAPIGILAEL
jgi:hypothetical protein